MGFIHKSKNKSISTSRPEQTQPSSSGEPAKHIPPSSRSTRSVAASPPQSLRRIFSQRAEAYTSPIPDSRPPPLPELKPGRYSNLSSSRLEAPSTDLATDCTRLHKGVNLSQVAACQSSTSLQGSAASNTSLPRTRLGTPVRPSPGWRDMNSSTSELQGNGRTRVRQDVVPNQAPSSSATRRNSWILPDQLPPSRARDEEAAQKRGVDEITVLQNRLRELDYKDDDYAKLKGLYKGERTRVYNLQNAIASQQMTKTHTILDDTQYMQLFQQLDGAITTLAFNVRKDWAVVPKWLKDYVHEDAAAVGTKEMTAVGRALLSRVVHDEIFEQHFHPGIYENLSKALKKIELNLRCLHINSAITEESRERGAALVAAWRTATMEGLSGLIQRDNEEGKAKLTMILTKDWLSRLREFFKSPAPACLESGLQSIIEIALNLLEFKAFETRDIQTVYFLPNQVIDTRLMTKDTSLPTLPTGDGSDATNLNAPDEQSITRAPKKRSTLTAFRKKMQG
ncbi:hypothetical protein KEM54_005961, partial [Ascosphaera aggregata]